MNTAISQTKANSGRKSFLLVCTAFLIPIILAKLALTNQWFNYGVTNQGQLLNKPTSLSELELSHIQPESKWLIVFNLPEQCQASCVQQFNLLSNTYIALGKEMPRVQSILLGEQMNADKLDLARWQLHAKSNSPNSVLAESNVLIVDPLGNVVLVHQPPTETEALPAFGKAILADMKKLLKYSRIG